jgi:cytochrome c-type biogenesis protein CcmH/NrfG
LADAFQARAASGIAGAAVGESDSARTLIDRFGWVLPATMALGIPVLFDPQASDGFILPRVSLLIAGAGVTLLLRLRSGGDGFGSLGLPAVAVAAAALVACVLSVNVPVSAVGAYERYDGLIVCVSYLAVFGASAWFLRTTGQRRRTVTCFLIGCCAVAIEAIWQYSIERAQRPDGNLGQAGLLGALLAMAVPLALNRARRDWRWLVPLPLLLGGLVLSGSRAAWLGSLAASGVLLLFAVPARRRPLAVAGAALLPLLGLALVLGTPLRHLNNDSGEPRLHMWSDSVGLIAARPVTGWGEDTFGLVYGQFQSGNWDQGAPDRAHSEPLDLLATQGVTGLLAAAWFWVTFWRRLLKRADRLAVSEEAAAIGAAWVAYAVWALLNFEWAPVTGPLWLLCGVAWAALREPADTPARLRRPPVWVAALVAPVAGAAVIAFAVLPAVADRYEFAGDHATAAALDPLQAYYHEQVGIAAIDRDDLATAEAELRRAGDLGEDDAGSFAELGNVEAALGNRAAARQSYERAIQIDPYYADARTLLQQLEAGGHS